MKVVRPFSAPTEQLNLRYDPPKQAFMQCVQTQQLEYTRTRSLWTVLTVHSRETRLASRETRRVSRETRLVSRETRLVSRETRRVSRETRRVSRDDGNFPLGGTVVHRKYDSKLYLGFRPVLFLKKAFCLEGGLRGKN